VVPAGVRASSAAVATEADRLELAALRRRVFVDEQAVPVDLEQDGLDDVAIHAIARDTSGRVVGTGRLVVDQDGPSGSAERGNVGRIGRMAVAVEARGTGIGAALLAVLEASAISAGCERLELHAQIRAEGFYRRAGYLAEGHPFQEAGIAHVAMGKDLNGPVHR